MQRMYQYKDAEGVLCVGLQNAPDASRAAANRLLGITAASHGWTEVEAFDHRLPPHEVRKHVDAVRVLKGLETRYTDEQKLPPVEGAVSKFAPAEIKDHAEGADAGKIKLPQLSDEDAAEIDAPVSDVPTPIGIANAVIAAKQPPDEPPAAGVTANIPPTEPAPTAAATV